MRTRPIEALEAAMGRQRTVADFEVARTKARGTPEALTEADFALLEFYGGAQVATDARARREAILHPAPPPPPPAPAPVPVPQVQTTTVKRVVRDAQGRIDHVLEEVVPVVGQVGAVADRREDLEASIAKSQADVLARVEKLHDGLVAEVNSRLLWHNQNAASFLQRLTDVERDLSLLKGRSL